MQIREVKKIGRMRQFLCGEGQEEQIVTVLDFTDIKIGKSGILWENNNHQRLICSPYSNILEVIYSLNLNKILCSPSVKIAPPNNKNIIQCDGIIFEDVYMYQQQQILESSQFFNYLYKNNIKNALYLAELQTMIYVLHNFGLYHGSISDQEIGFSIGEMRMALKNFKWKQLSSNFNQNSLDKVAMKQIFQKFKQINFVENKNSELNLIDHKDQLLKKLKQVCIYNNQNQQDSHISKIIKQIRVYSFTINNNFQIFTQKYLAIKNKEYIPNLQIQLTKFIKSLYNSEYSNSDLLKLQDLQKQYGKENSLQISYLKEKIPLNENFLNNPTLGWHEILIKQLKEQGKEKQWLETVQNYVKLLKKCYNSYNLVKIHFYKAKINQFKGHYYKAIHQLNKCLKEPLLTQQKAILHNQYGNILSKLGKYNESIDHYLQSLKLKNQVYGENSLRHLPTLYNIILRLLKLDKQVKINYYYQIIKKIKQKKQFQEWWKKQKYNNNSMIKIQYFLIKNHYIEKDDELITSKKKKFQSGLMLQSTNFPKNIYFNIETIWFIKYFDQFSNKATQSLVQPIYDPLHESLWSKTQSYLYYEYLHIFQTMINTNKLTQQKIKEVYNLFFKVQSINKYISHNLLYLLAHWQLSIGNQEHYLLKMQKVAKFYERFNPQYEFFSTIEDEIISFYQSRPKYQTKLFLFYQKIIKKNSITQSHYFDYIKLCYKCERYIECLQLAQNYLKKYNDNQQIRYLIGKCQMKCENYHSAIISFQKSNLLKGLISLIQCYWQVGNLEQFYKQINYLIQLKNFKPDHNFLKIIQILLKLNNQDQRINKYLQDYIELQSSDQSIEMQQILLSAKGKQNIQIKTTLLKKLLEKDCIKNNLNKYKQLKSQLILSNLIENKTEFDQVLNYLLFLNINKFSLKQQIITRLNFQHLQPIDKYIVLQQLQIVENQHGSCGKTTIKLLQCISEYHKNWSNIEKLILLIHISRMSKIVPQIKKEINQYFTKFIKNDLQTDLSLKFQEFNWSKSILESLKKLKHNYESVIQLRNQLDSNYQENIQITIGAQIQLFIIQCNSTILEDTQIQRELEFILQQIGSII